MLFSYQRNYFGTSSVKQWLPRRGLRVRFRVPRLWFMPRETWDGPSAAKGIPPLAVCAGPVITRASSRRRRRGKTTRNYRTGARGRLVILSKNPVVRRGKNIFKIHFYSDSRLETSKRHWIHNARINGGNLSKRLKNLPTIITYKTQGHPVWSFLVTQTWTGIQRSLRRDIEPSMVINCRQRQSFFPNPFRSQSSSPAFQFPFLGMKKTTTHSTTPETTEKFVLAKNTWTTRRL